MYKHIPAHRNATALGCTCSSSATLIQGNHGSLALFRATGNTTGSFGHPQYTTGTDKPQWVQWRATKMLRGTELCEERLWEMGRSRLEKKRLWGAASRSPGPAGGVCAQALHRDTRQDSRHKLQWCRCDLTQRKGPFW